MCTGSRLPRFFNIAPDHLTKRGISSGALHFEGIDQGSLPVGAASGALPLAA